MILIIESYVKDNNGANTIFNCRLSTFDIWSFQIWTHLDFVTLQNSPTALSSQCNTFSICLLLNLLQNS